MKPGLSLAQLTTRARRIRQLYAAQARRDGRMPWGPAELAQGFVGDVGDPMKLTMAKSGLRPAKDLDVALAHELADCLWSILLLADAYNVKLEPAFLRAMQQLEQKAHGATSNQNGTNTSLPARLTCAQIT